MVLVQDRFSASQKTDPAHLGGSQDGGELMKNILPSGYFRSLCFDFNRFTPVGINTLFILNTNPHIISRFILQSLQSRFCPYSVHSTLFDPFRLRLVAIRKTRIRAALDLNILRVLPKRAVLHLFAELIPLDGNLPFILRRNGRSNFLKTHPVVYLLKVPKHLLLVEFIGELPESWKSRFQLPASAQMHSRG